MKNADLGFNHDQLLVVPLRGNKLDANPEVFKNEVAQIPQIEQLSLTSSFPNSSSRSITTFTFEGLSDDDGKMLQFYEVDYDFAEILGFEFLQGRNFKKEFGTDEQGILINEELAKQLSWDDAIGKQIFMSEVVDEQFVNIPHKVLGVVKNFHFESLHSVINPLAFFSGIGISLLNSISISPVSPGLIAPPITFNGAVARFKKTV